MIQSFIWIEKNDSVYFFNSQAYLKWVLNIVSFVGGWSESTENSTFHLDDSKSIEVRNIKEIYIPLETGRVGLKKIHLNLSNFCDIF